MYSETPDTDRRIGDEKPENLGELGDFMGKCWLGRCRDMRYQKGYSEKLKTSLQPSLA